MFIQVEEVTLPFRFLVKTAHFIAVLATVFDTNRVVSNMVQIDPTTATGADLDRFNSTKTSFEGLAYTSVACFCIEYITLFMGVSIFLRHITVCNILAHAAGLILTILFYADSWSLASFAAFFAVFSAVPALVEVLALMFVTKMAVFIKY